MIDVMARAQEIADLIPEAARPTVSVRKINGWGVLVEPTPTYEFPVLCATNEAVLQWKIYAIAFNPGGEQAAAKLHELVQLVAGELAVISAVPALYQLPDREQPAPAYMMTVDDGNE